MNTELDAILKGNLHNGSDLEEVKFALEAYYRKKYLGLVPKVDPGTVIPCDNPKEITNDFLKGYIAHGKATLEAFGGGE